MRYLAQILLLILFPLAMRAIGPAPQAKPTTKDGAKIETNYDGVKNKTTVTLTPMLVLGQEREGIFLGAEFSFTGKKPEGAEAPGQFLEPPIYVTLTSVSSQPKYARQHEITFVYDDQRRSVANPEFESQSKDGLIVETVRAPFIRDYLYQVLDAKKVAVRFGATEIELTRAQLEALRRLARRLAQMAQ